MKIIALSDTHRKHREIILPDDKDIDCLICAGDITSNGEMKIIEDFANWLKELPYNYKLIQAGNHDGCFEVRDKTHAKSIEKRDAAIKLIQDAGSTYLEHESITVEGVKMFFSPYTPEFYNWSFNVSRGKNLAEKWKDIPEDTQLLCTHGPPHTILDEAPRGFMDVENVGCQDLFNRIQELPNLTHHIFGHIHHAYGIKQVGSVQYINAAICTESYQPTNKPIVFEI